MKKKVKKYNYIKVIVGVVFLLAAVLTGYLIYFYNSIESNKSEGHDETIKYIYDMTDIVTIDKITSFQSNELFHIATGEDTKGEKVIVFLPLEDKENFTIVPLSETISEAKIIEKWDSFCVKCTSLTTNYAMIEGEPLWELTYDDGSNRYVFDYFSLDDGEQFEQLRLYQKYR